MNLIDITTQIADQPVLIEQYYLYGPIQNPEQNDLFNYNIKNIFKTPVQQIVYQQSIFLANGIEIEGSFFNKLQHERKMDLSHVHTNGDERVFLVANLHSDTNKRVVITLHIEESIYKVWVNNSIVNIGINRFNNHSFESDRCKNIFYEVEKGNNIIILELQNMNDKSIGFILRVSDYNFEMIDTHNSLVYNNFFLNKLKVYFLHKSYDVRDMQYYEFLLLPLDCINIDIKQKVSVKVKDIEDNVINTLEVDFYQKILYPLEQVRKSSLKTLILTFEVELYLKTGQKYSLSNNIVVNDMDCFLNKIKHEVDDMDDDGKLNSFDKANTLGRLENIKNDEPGLKKYEVKFLITLIDAIKNGLHFEDIYISEQSKIVYFQSDLDDQIEKVYISLPSGYDSNYKYPLILFMATGRYELHSFTMDNCLKEPVIIADVSGRGVTTGSYIGEASIMESIGVIKKLYSIDENRIYMLGFSNGAFAAWTFAQSYPGLFAGIVAVSGRPYLSNMMNLSNTKIFVVSSECDYMLREAYEEPIDALDKYSNTIKIFPSKCTHNLLYFYLFKQSIFEELLSNALNKYPLKVSFRTERIRHDKAFYLKINGMEQEQIFSQIEAEIIGENTIKLITKNITNIEISLPESINRSEFKIELNNDQLFEFHDCKEESICFTKKSNEYILAKSTPEHSFRASKGMGFYDVYMDRMKIIIPSNHANENSKKILFGVANKFSKPSTQGWDPVIYTNYSIIEDTKIDDSIHNNNLILIGVNDNSVIQEMSHKIPINFSLDGYEYCGKYIKEDYCIMQICQNPFNNKKCVLVINANNINLLKKSIFIRRVSIPSYANGSHPFLNNVAIIFNGKEYLSVDHWGKEPKAIL